MIKQFFAIVCIVGFLAPVDAHSWVACTKYDTTQSADQNYYRDGACYGYPRAWTNLNSNLFGEDRGFNYQPGASACRDPRTGGDYSAGYSSRYPMAKYYPGENVCIAWPAKNHKADTCTNPYIPDTQLTLFRSGPNPASDPSQDGFKQNIVVDWSDHVNGQIDHKGFQNCPKFCENTDKALCWRCFTVPSDLTVGAVYTFQWYWIFNPGAPYTSCFEAEIVSSASAASTTAPATTAPAGSGTSGSGTSGSATSGSATTAPATTAPATTGVDAGTTRANPNSGDSVVITRKPLVIPKTVGSTFTVTIGYSTTGSRDLIVDILDSTLPTPKWYGKGIAKSVTGAGSLDLQIRIHNALDTSKTYFLRGWLVEAGQGEVDLAWAFELDRDDQAVQYGDSVVYDTSSSSGNGNGSTGEVSESSATSLFVGSLFSLFAAFIALF